MAAQPARSNNNPDEASRTNPRLPCSARCRAPDVEDFGDATPSSASLMKKNRLQHALTDAKHLRPEAATLDSANGLRDGVLVDRSRDSSLARQEQQQHHGDSCDHEDTELFMLLQQRARSIEDPEQHSQQVYYDPIAESSRHKLLPQSLPSVFVSPDDLQYARTATQLTIAKMRATLIDPPSLERLLAALTTELPLSFAHYKALKKHEKRDARCWYACGKLVGKGTFGRVYSAQHRLLIDSQVAIKSYFREPGAAVCCRPPISNPWTSRTTASRPSNKRPPGEDALDWKRVRQEVQMMAALRPHPSIIQFIEAFETPTQMHVVMEFVKGENLCDHLRRTNATTLRLSEPEARGIFRQLCAAVASLHDQHVIHRDLKLENVLVDRRGRAKLIDFGFSQFDYSGSSSSSGSDAVVKNFCGTPSYMAPEVVTSASYDGKSVDVWSLGVLLYVLLCGRFPFQGQSFHQLHQSVLQVSTSSSIKGWSFPGGLSKNAQNLIRTVLVVDPKKRPRVHNILSHPWMTTQLAASFTVDANKSVQVGPPVGDGDHHEERFFFAFLQWEEAQERMCETLGHLYGLHEAQLKNALRDKRQNGVTAFIRLAILTAQKKSQLLADSAHRPPESSEDNHKSHNSNRGSSSSDSGERGESMETAADGLTHKQHLEKLIGLVKASLIV